MQNDLDGPGLYPLFRDEHPGPSFSAEHPCDDDSNQLLLVFFVKTNMQFMSCHPKVHWLFFMRFLTNS